MNIRDTKLEMINYFYVRDLKGNILIKNICILKLKLYNGLDEYFKYYPKIFHYYLNLIGLSFII